MVAPKKAPPKLQFQILAEENGKPLAQLKTTGSYKWTKNVEGVRVIEWQILALANQEFPDVKAETPESADVKVKANQMLVNSQYVKTNLISSNRKFSFTVVPLKNSVIEENCSSSFIGLQPVKEDVLVPFFVGISCETKNQEVNLHLSFPKDVDLANSNLFEKIGKGENYKIYELKKINAAKGDLGNFEFLYGNQRYRYNLKSLKSESVDQINRDSRFFVSGGIISSTLKTGNKTYKDSKPIVGITLLPQNVFNQIFANASAETTIGNISNEKSISYYQLQGQLVYQIKLGSLLTLGPVLDYIISGQKSGTGVDYQTNQLATGINLVFQVGRRFSVQLDYLTEKLGSGVLKAHSLIRGQIFYRDQFSQAGWGLGFHNQTYNVMDVNFNERQFDQIGIYLQRSF